MRLLTRLAALFLIIAACAARTLAADPYAEADPEETRWRCSLRATAIILQRDNISSFPLVQDDGNDVINSSQLGFNPRLGFDVSLFCAITKKLDVSVRYFTIEQANSFASGEVVIDGVINTAPPTPIDPGRVSFAYESTLQSGEINLSQKLGENSSIFGGVRFMEIREMLRGNFETAAPFTYDVAANNRLYGFQTGVEAPLWICNTRFRLDTICKAALFVNDANQVSFFDQPLGTPAEAAAEDIVVSPMVEAGIVATYRPTPNCNVFAGYQMLWLDSVALAPDQVGSTGNLAVGGTAPSVIDTSSVLYHGGFLGIEFSF